jgi:zinc finger CCCH domain-containing protein 13
MVFSFLCFLPSLVLSFDKLPQNQRASTGNIPSTAPLSHVPFAQQAQHNLNLFQQQQIYHQNQQQIHSNRLEPLYESRLDDRNFMPDGMVPGLRSAPPPRTRENTGYPDVLDDSLHLNHHHQRLPQQHRAVDQMYSGSMYQQTGRNNGFPLQPPHYRGGASPISNQPPSLQNSQQRLPPGLANLGGRPPLEPSQYLGMPGMPTPGLHGGLHLNGSSQPPYNAFTAGSNMNYVGGPQGRAPHQLPNPVVHQVMGGPGHQSHMDLRSANSGQVLGMSGVGLGGIRGIGGGFPGHQGPPTQGQGPLLAMRPQQQQQQQQLPPHLMPHLLPPHLQQQGPPGPNGSQPTHDLMALLMGGTHRE